MDIRQHYPVAIVQDRYSGIYSGGDWLAISRAKETFGDVSRVAYLVRGGPHGSDLEAAEFWSDPPDWIAVGNSPQEALANLLGGIRVVPRPMRPQNI
jgi:hypothetical protein